MSGPMTDELDRSPERELGRRLARLRDAAGLTQRELARRLGIGQSALSRIESGQRRLTAAQAGQTARILGVDAGALLDPGPEALDAGGPFALESDAAGPFELASDAEGPSAGWPGAAEPSAFQALAAMAAPFSAGPASMGQAADVRWRRRAAAPALEPPLFAEIVRDALEVEALADELGTGRPRGAQAGARPVRGAARAPRHTSPARSAFEALPPATQTDPVRLARFWRHELGVGDQGPLPDLVPLLEAAGVDVVHARLDVSVPEGACALAPRPWLDAPPRAFVFLNGRERPVVMQRFALAHEFAHLALGHGEAYDERIDWSGRSRRETDANAFAEEFVAPLAAVRGWAELTAPMPDDPVDTVVHLGNHFGVSVWVARNRLRAAELLPGPTVSRSLDQQLRALGSRLTALQPFLGGLRDTLSVLTTESRPGAEQNPWRIAPEGVRVPGRMREQALGLLESRAVSVARVAEWLRIDESDLEAQLDQLGLE